MRAVHVRTALRRALLRSAPRATSACSSAVVHKPVLQLTPSTYAYLVANTREPAALRQCREVTEGLPGARMQVPPEQGALLSMLVELLDAKRVLEVGTFTGYSSTALALALPLDGLLVTCDVNAETMAVARQTWASAGVAERVDGRLGKALETMEGLLAEGGAGSFDLAFVDADKCAYVDYFQRCLQLVRLGGLIAVDNTLWYGKCADPEVQDKQTVALRAFNAAVLADERVSHCLVPIGDGLTLLRRRI